MNAINCSLILSIILIANVRLSAQMKGKTTDIDKSALEGIIIEKYYISDSRNSADTTGGKVPDGAITYRIFVDLKSGYNLQAVYGVPKHELKISTTTQFFNNSIAGKGTGDKIESFKLNDNSVAFDSWLTMDAASDSHNGILKSEDKDGTLIRKKQFENADGLILGKIKPVTFFGIDLSVFISGNSSTFSTNNGSLAIFGGIKGPTETNKVLIAQLTTDGKISFELNLQVGTPTGGSIQFVAKNPEAKEIQNISLVQ